ncbi:hypothetical protein ACW23B_07610 [Streptomyces albidoflavus]
MRRQPTGTRGGLLRRGRAARCHRDAASWAHVLPPPAPDLPRLPPLGRHPGRQFARHDPPDPAGVPGFLISCTGSLRQAPADGEQPLLFEVGAGAAGAGQLDLFGAGVDVDETRQDAGT